MAKAATKAKATDPITLQVIGGALDTIAKEMGHVLYRMSFSSIIRESQDLGAGLFDAKFNTLCESDSTPLHIGSIPGYLHGIQKRLQGGEWHDGDVIIHNHPYFGASHSPDILIAIPIFWEGQIVGFSANTAHHIDIGSATPGLIIDIPDVFAEGMLFAGIKLYERGKRNEALWQFMGDNSRTSTMLRDDIEAQIAAARLGVTRFCDLIERYGLETMQTACDELMDYSEQMLRKRIAEIPDGEYFAEGWCDDDGRNRDVRLPIKVTVRIKGDSATVDLTGSADQVPTGYNVPFEGSTKVACFFAFRALLLDQATTEEYIPQNQGSFRPDRGDRAPGLHLQSQISSRRRGPIHAVQSLDRLCRAGAGAGYSQQRHGWQFGQPVVYRLRRAAAERRLLGVLGRSTRDRTAAGPNPTDRTASTT